MRLLFEALAYLECGTYDGAILDIMMPKKGGLTVLKEIRRQGINTPVLMLTAKAEIDDRVLGLDSGANDYLTKPFAAPELLARIRAMTRTQMTQNTSSLSFGNLSLNQTSFELSSPSGSYQLTNKEFQMLRSSALKIIRALGVQGGCNVQFALDPHSFRELLRPTPTGYFI